MLLSQRFERFYVFFLHVEIDGKHALIDGIHATHYNL